MSTSRTIIKNHGTLPALHRQGISPTQQPQHWPALSGLPHDLHPAVQTHFTNVGHMARVPAPFHRYITRFFEQHGGRLATAREVASHYERSARVLEVHGDDRALRSLHLEMRVCELLAGRDDVTYIGLREDVRGQEIDAIATIAGVTFYFEAKTGETDNEQMRRLIARAKQSGAGLIYVDGLVGEAKGHFSARHLEAMIGLPTEEFLLGLNKRALIKPNTRRVVDIPVALEPLTSTPRIIAEQAYRRARALIKERELRDNMATIDAWLMHLAYDKIAYIWNKVAEEPTLAETRLHKFNNRERATWLSSKPDLLEERLEHLFVDEQLEFIPANHAIFKPGTIELSDMSGASKLVLERRSPQEALTLLKSQNYPDDISRYLGHPEVSDVILARNPEGMIMAYLAINSTQQFKSVHQAPIGFIRAHKIEQNRQNSIKGLFFGMTAYVLDRLRPQWASLPADAPCIGGILLKIMDRFREREFNGERSPINHSNIDPFFYDEDLPLTVIPVEEAKFIQALFKLDAQPIP